MDRKSPEGVNGKGKEKAPWDSSSVADSLSTSSGGSTVSRMLLPGSRTSSRASSVLSDAPSNISLSVESLSLPLEQPAHSPNNDSPPLFHAHGAARRQQLQLPPYTIAQQHHEQEITPARTKLSLPDSSKSQQSASSRPSTSTSSPVTRSNCRFHKISLPREEGGPRVYFLVPGCSLGDRELMEAQEIEDHGYATIEDGSRIVRDIESLDFSLYLVGFLRQLVGVDLLREQEVYYLPQPGEDPNRIGRRKPGVTRLSFRDVSDAGNPANSPRVVPRAHHSPSSSLSGAPHSVGSMSTSARKAQGSDQDSSSAVSYSDHELDDESLVTPTRKQRSNPGVSSKTALPSSSNVDVYPQSSYSTRAARRRKRDSESTTHKPPEEADGDLSNEVNASANGRPSELKRARTSDARTRNEDSDRKAKRKRLRLTSSTTAVEED